MKMLKKLILITIFVIGSYLSGHARIMASDISWRCLGGDSFLIKLTVYTDCNNTASGIINVYFNCFTTSSLITSKSLTAPTPVDVTPVCNGLTTRCQSSTSTFPYGVNKYVYQGIVNLNAAGSCCDILMSFSGVRNSSITTLSNTGFYTEARMNRCQSPCDHSPQFSNMPVQIICVGQDMSIMQGLTDSNKTTAGAMIDSFTYEWTQPKSNSTTNVPYLGSYSYTNSIYYWGYPNSALPFPRGLHLDPQTGDIQFRPMKAEVTVMVVKVNEYRNGILIGVLRREIQTIVIACVFNNPPLVTTVNNIRAKSVCSGDTVKFKFSTSDPNTADSVKISWNKAIPGATWTDSNGLAKQASAVLTWVPTDANVSSLPYTFIVAAKDNACPINASFSQSYQITVKPKPQAIISVSDSGCGEFWFSALRISGSGPVYLWQAGAFTFSPMIGAITSHKFSPGIYPYIMTMIASGCSNTYFDSVIVDTSIQVKLNNDTDVCYGTSITLHAIVKFNKGTTKMVWGSGNKIFGANISSSKTFTVTSDTVIWASASDSSTCVATDTIHIKMHKLPKVNLGPDVRICSYGQANIKANYLIDQGAKRSITWTDLKTNIVVSSDTILSTYDSSRFSCKVVDSFNCVGYDSVRVIKNPEIIASAFGQTICYGNYAELEADSTGGGNAQYLWYEGSKFLSSSRKLKIQPLTTTDYWLKVKENISGTICKDSTMIRVKVDPLPVIRINPIDKRCLIGAIISLNNFVTVDGIFKAGGVWSSSSVGLIYDDKFNPVAAGVSTAPGWKVQYDYVDPTTGCYNKDSAYVTIWDLPKPFAGFDEPVCRGTKKSLTGTPLLPPGTWRGIGVAGSYPNWKFNPDTFGLVDGGKYNAIYHYIDNHQCENEDTVQFTVSSIPSTPVISFSTSDSFVECNLQNGNYEWSYQPDTFTTATKISNNSRRINPRIYCNNCYFNVVFTDSNGCSSASSAHYHLLINSVGNGKPLSGFVYYPNPANSLLFVENPTNKPVIFTLDNVLGKSVLKTMLSSGKNAINIQNFKPGIYFIYLDANIAGKLLIE